jgi:molecular chaperone DnaJ
VAIPEGTQSGRQFRLKGKGMPVLRSSQRGDLYIEVAVETPVKLTKRQKELLREFETASQTGTHPEAEGFLARLKEFWKGGDPA